MEPLDNTQQQQPKIRIRTSSSMDPPPLNHQDDDVFLDANDLCSTPSFKPTTDDLPELSASASTISDPQPVSPNPRNSHPLPSSPTTTIRRRPIRRLSPVKEYFDPGLDSPGGAESDSINGARTSSRHDKNLRISKEDDNNFAGKRDSKEMQQISAFQAPISVTEENNERSTVTTAANDDAAVDSADSAPQLGDSASQLGDSASQLGDSSSSFLEFISVLVIKAIGFQIKLLVIFVTYPTLFLFNCCMFFVDPFGTMMKGKAFFIGIFGRVWGVMFWCISPYFERMLTEKNLSIWSVAFRCGWGFLWSIYVCCILFGLFVSSFVFSGFLMKFLVEKPIQIRQVLNFDYTKHSPVAYVPIISCDGVVAAKDSENDMQVRKWMGERVIPSKHNVQVTVSLRVPESGYNRNLGVFQARVDFLLSNGKTIASTTQPCMLRFRSEPIRLFMTFLNIAPLVTGYISETQTLNVKMRGFIEGDVPTSCLKVTLEQRAEYQPGAGIPEIYDASLVIESEISFFKRIIWLWKLSIFIWITMMTFVMELLLVLVCCRPIIIPRTRQRAAYARGPAT